MDLPESTPDQLSPSPQSLPNDVAPPPSAATPADPDEADVEVNKDIAAFSYLWIMSIVVYFLRRKSPFVRFHALQAMILFLISIVVLFIPVISTLLELGVLGLMVLGFINAAQGQRKDIPLVGPLSRREITLRDAWKQIVDIAATLMKSFRSTPSQAPSPSPPPSDSPQA